MSAEFGDLPSHMKVIVTGTVVIVGSAWGLIKFIKPFIDNITPKPTTTATDAVVISAALADGKVISELRASLDRNTEVNEKTNIILTLLYEAVVKLTMKL